MFVPLTLPSPATILTVSTFSRLLPKVCLVGVTLFPVRLAALLLAIVVMLLTGTLGTMGCDPHKPHGPYVKRNVLLGFCSCAECSLAAFPLCTIQVLMIMMVDAVTPSTYVSAGTGDS